MRPRNSFKPRLPRGPDDEAVGIDNGWVLRRVLVSGIYRWEITRRNPDQGFVQEHQNFNSRSHAIDYAAAHPRED